MGGDRKTVKMARISYQSVAKDGEADKRLIQLLIKNGHLTPFEHSVFTFHIKAPIFVARQWFRHRTGSFSERSGRYTKFDLDDCYIPDNERAKGNEMLIRAQTESAFYTYKELIDKDIPLEVARMVLPLNLYTEWFWTVNARNLMHFLTLRTDKRAQKEIREYARAIEAFFEDAMPFTYEAFKNLEVKQDG